MLSVATATSLEDALAKANGVEYGLTTSIFTRHQHRDALHRRRGGGHGARQRAHRGWRAQLPFGGTKSTGVGEREMAEEGLNFFTEIKTVFVNYGGAAGPSLTR